MNKTDLKFGGLNPLSPLFHIVKIYVLVLALGNFYSCYAQHPPGLQKIDSIKFDVGYLSNHRYRGIIMDKNTGSPLFYFGDPVTHKVISIFSHQGNLKLKIPLQSSIAALGEIENFQVIEPDTIVMFGKQNNRIVFINKHGEIWSQINLDSVISPFNDYVYTYRASFSGISISNGIILLRAEYQNSNKGANPPSLSEYFKKAIHLPYFLKIENLYSNQNINYQFGLNGFYASFMDENNSMSELPVFTIYDDRALVHSIFSDTIYVIDINTLNIMQKVKVSSDHTDVSSKPILLSTPEKYEEDLNRIKYGGHISKVIYDSAKGLYLVCVAWKNKEEKPLSRQYSYCLYDTSGYKISEIIQPIENYHAGIIFQYGDKYYIQSKLLNNENNRKQLAYSVFDLLY